MYSRIAFALVVLTTCACACSNPPPPEPVVEKPPPQEPPPPPPLDAAKVLTAITENAPSVEVSLQVKSPHEVGVELDGAGPPAIALSLLSSLTQKLPNTRATKLTLEANAWKASLTTSSVEAPADPTSLPNLIEAARPVFGDVALLSTGTVDATAASVLFKGTLASDKTIANAGAAVAPGFKLTRVEAGPPFLLEIAPAPAAPQ